MNCDKNYITYYTNCSNRLKLCKQCIINGGGKNHYQPIDKELTPHPGVEAYNRKKRQGAQANKRGKQAEKKAIQRLANKLVSPTVASGAIKGDGDAKLAGLCNLEHKLRNRLGITKAEYEKGKRQGVGVWQLTDPDTNTSIYILSEDVFVKLLKRYYESESIEEGL